MVHRRPLVAASRFASRSLVRSGSPLYATGATPSSAGISASAIVLPSGFQADSARRPLTRFTYRPSSGVTYTAPRGPLAVHVMRSPAGDHAGCSMRASLSTVLSVPVSRSRMRSFRLLAAIETYAMWRPSGEIAGHCSASSPFVSRASAPFACRVQSSAAARRARTNTIRPSRATVGSPSNNGDAVIRSGSAVAPVALTATRHKSKLPERLEEKTIAEPSGVQAGSRSHAGPIVSFVHSPRAEMIHRSPCTVTASRPSRAYAGCRAATPAWTADGVCATSVSIERTSSIERLRAGSEVTGSSMPHNHASTRVDGTSGTARADARRGQGSGVRGQCSWIQRILKEEEMPRGDKSSYTDKQKRQARHIEQGYEGRGVGEREAERRAWATVNAETHGGKRSGSGRGRSENHEPSRKGGRLGGSSQSHSERSRAAKKGWETRRRHGNT